MRQKLTTKFKSLELDQIPEPLTRLKRSTCHDATGCTMILSPLEFQVGSLISNLHVPQPPPTLVATLFSSSYLRWRNFYPSGTFSAPSPSDLRQETQIPFFEEKTKAPTSRTSFQISEDHASATNALECIRGKCRERGVPSVSLAAR